MAVCLGGSLVAWMALSKAASLVSETAGSMDLYLVALMADHSGVPLAE
jgi:hypothetical protein